MSLIPHESALGHVTGAAIYSDDLCSRYPGLLHAWPVLAPHAHARLLRLSFAAVRNMPGVAAVLTAEDVPGENDTGSNRHDEPLFPAEVMYHNQPVAWVLGETLEAARAAALAVGAEYEPRAAILTIDEAIAGASFLADPLRIVRGEPLVIDRSPLRFAGELRIGGQEHFYLETQCTIASVDALGGVLIESSTQHPTETQEIVSRVLGIPWNQVTVECVRMGGAFGGKEVQANAWAAVAALGAWKTKRPVRVRLPRVLDMALTGKRHPFLARYQAGFGNDGRLEGVRIALYSDGGWSLDLSGPVISRAMFHVDNAYLLPNCDITGQICLTHKTSQTAFRGFGGPQGMIVIEEIMDQAARRLGLPPETVRERNLYREGDTTHYGQAVKHAGRIHTIWHQLKTSSSFDARRGAVQAFNAAHAHRRRGIAITPMKFGISFTATFMNQAGALVLIYRDGSVQVNHGGAEMGQGLHTKIRQIAAAGLGIGPENIRVMPTNTGKVPNTSATAASASTDLNGAAVLAACEQLKQRLAPVAAGMLGCAESEIRFCGGTVYNAADPAGGIPFGKIVSAAHRQRVPLFAQGYYSTPGIRYDPATLSGKPFHYFVWGAAVSEVELDLFTGDCRVRRVDILEDSGSSFSPLIDRGQIEGGFMQGLGWLTIEELLWDAKGRLATGGASTYKLPSWSELPDVFNVELLENAADEDVIFGSKAVGEPPLMLAFSVREAIRDAIASCGEGEPVAIDSPATPERIYFAIQRAKARIGAGVPA
ncbi:MAG TPA: xanthine dehydrogenase molybdopterin binding subunit [Bryobacteraceae bacterium]|nr:xanthine dehydrogenase molybdopterin binding subunit [Bryobacteraceae bacterium]